MRIAVGKETAEGERRVALVPDAAQKLIEDEHEVVVASGAGGDFYPDEAYQEVGASIVEDPLEGAEVVLRVRAPGQEEVDGLPQGCLLVCFLDPSEEREVLEKLAERRVTVFSMSSIPRTGAAQAMDANSTMGSIAGYQAVLMAAEAAGRYLPMMTTAAGTTKAASVLVIGVGVAGLQAIATARRLGAEVEAFDIRPEVADQVRSLGATFIEADGDREAEEEPEEEGPQVGRAEAFVKALLGLPPEFGRRRKEAASGSDEDEDKDEAEDQSDEQDDDGDGKDEEQQRKDQELMLERLAEMDVVLTAALVPGQEAPTLVTEDMIERMKPGSVLFDLAVESGGNCELSKPDEVVTHGHVRIYGPLNLPSTMPMHASYLLSRNMSAVLSHLLDEEGQLKIDFDDEITTGAVLAHEGEVRES